MDKKNPFSNGTDSRERFKRNVVQALDVLTDRTLDLISVHIEMYVDFAKKNYGLTVVDLPDRVVEEMLDEVIPGLAKSEYDEDGNRKWD